MLRPVVLCDFLDGFGASVSSGFGRDVGMVFVSIVEVEFAEIVVDLVRVVLGKRFGGSAEGESGDELMGRVVVHAAGIEEAVMFGVVIVKEGGEGLTSFGTGEVVEFGEGRDAGGGRGGWSGWCGHFG